MKYLTRNIALDEIRRYCPNKIGFEEAFAHVGMFTLTAFVTMIEEHIPIRIYSYTECIDFLDGNGFSVEPDGHNGYTITPLTFSREVNDK